MFKKSKVVLKEEAPSSYKVFIRCSKYICLVLAFVMIFTSINWNAFVVKGSKEINKVSYEELSEDDLNQETDPYDIPI